MCRAPKPLALTGREALVRRSALADAVAPVAAVAATRAADHAGFCVSRYTESVNAKIKAEHRY